MSSKPDDLDAIRTIAEALKQFDANEQERIIRWTREKLGLLAPKESSTEASRGTQSEQNRRDAGTIDIKTFVTQKNPSSDNQLAATIAYYYAFRAPQAKESINSVDLRQACRLIYGTSKLKNPAQTLINAHNSGLLDKAGDGAYRVNTVGENLVAMTLPSTSSASGQPKKRKIKARKAKTKRKKRK
jgi:hypothetical protein